MFVVCDGDPIKLQMTNEDEELDIECDEQQVFGESQYPFWLPLFSCSQIVNSTRLTTNNNEAFVLFT